jgi:hypothetical protein
MKRLLCSIALAGFACAASAQWVDASDSAKTFAGRDVGVVTLQPAGARSFDDVVADTRAATSRTDSRLRTGVTPAIPEPQTYALLLAGLGAIVFVAVRRRRP